MAVASGSHVQGLNAGISKLKGKLPNKLIKRLRNLEACYNIQRHVTLYSCQQMLDEVSSALKQEPDEDGKEEFDEKHLANNENMTLEKGLENQNEAEMAEDAVREEDIAGTEETGAQQQHEDTASAAMENSASETEPDDDEESDSDDISSLSTGDAEMAAARTAECRHTIVQLEHVMAAADEKYATMLQAVIQREHKRHETWMIKEMQLSSEGGGT